MFIKSDSIFFPHLILKHETKTHIQIHCCQWFVFIKQPFKVFFFCFPLYRRLLQMLDKKKMMFSVGDRRIIIIFNGIMRKKQKKGNADGKSVVSMRSVNSLVSERTTWSLNKIRNHWSQRESMIELNIQHPVHKVSKNIKRPFCVRLQVWNEIEIVKCWRQNSVHIWK